MRRARQLGALLAALGGAATLLVGLVPAAWHWPARLGLLFGVPFLASVAASLLLPREPGREGASVKIGGTARCHAVVAVALFVDLGAVGAGYALGWTTFTYGEQALEAHKLLAVPLALPFTIAAATLGNEWALHARLWETLARAGRRGEALVLALGCGAALVLPSIAPGFEAGDPAFLAGSLALALAREGAALALFRSGGLFVAGAYRGTLVALESFGLGDWNSFQFPMANYVTSEPLFYLVRAAGGVLALAAVVALLRRGREPAA
jgi:hypothetical protein